MGCNVSKTSSKPKETLNQKAQQQQHIVYRHQQLASRRLSQADNGNEKCFGVLRINEGSLADCSAITDDFSFVSSTSAEEDSRSGSFCDRYQPYEDDKYTTQLPAQESLLDNTYNNYLPSKRGPFRLDDVKIKNPDTWDSCSTEVEVFY